MSSWYTVAQIKSQNAFQWSHWSAYQKYRKEWQMALLQVMGRPPAPETGKVSIEIVSYRARLMDFANLVGGAKPIPDALKSLGWIVDDSPQWFSCTYRQEVVPKKYRGTVIISNTINERQAMLIDTAQAWRWKWWNARPGSEDHIESAKNALRCARRDDTLEAWWAAFTTCEPRSRHPDDQKEITEILRAIRRKETTKP